MLAILIFASFAGQAAGSQQAELTLHDFKQFMVDSGYSIGRSVSEYSFPVTRPDFVGARNFEFSLSPGAGVAAGNRKVVGITIWVEFAVPRAVDVTAPFDLVSPEGSHVKTILAPHIGNTISASSTIAGVPKLTRAQLSAALTTAWDTADRYSKRFQPKFEPASGRRTAFIKNCERRLFAYPDGLSLSRLISYWGWNYTSSGGVGGIWGPGGQIGKHLFWCSARNYDPGGPTLLIMFEAKGLSSDVADWVSRTASKYPWAKLSPGAKAGVMDCVGSIKLSPTTTVGDVKRQILALLGKVEELERGLR